MKTKHASLLGVALCSAALLCSPAALAAPTIATSRACYVQQVIAKGVTIEVTGSGFTPGELVFAQIPAPGGLLDFVEATVSAQGTISATLPNVIPTGIEPTIEHERMQIKGVLSGAILAEAPFELTNLGVAMHPSVARPDRKVAYRFAGFTPGQPIYGHYLHHGHVALTHRFGRAEGPCGTLSARARFFPGRSSFSTYDVQFDDSKGFRAGSAPKVTTKLTIFHF
ncbi:MAG TPA: hypothetical protein VKU89_03765 [Solirubrobacteraceae bacterium]|nr:hypothetical protein [Solirubrobacteraceae bacterium]